MKDWVIDTARSRIEVRAKSTLHDSRSTGPLRGRVSGDPEALEGTAGGVVEIPVESFDFGNKLQTMGVLSKIEASKHPVARFQVTGAQVLSRSPWRVKVSGTLDYRARKTPFSFEATGSLTDTTLDARAEVPVNLPTIGITPPSMLFMKVADDVVASVHLVATR